MTHFHFSVIMTAQPLAAACAHGICPGGRLLFHDSKQHDHACHPHGLNCRCCDKLPAVPTAADPAAAHPLMGSGVKSSGKGGFHEGQWEVGQASHPPGFLSTEGTRQLSVCPRRDSRGERSPWLPLEMRPDSPGEPGMQPRTQEGKGNGNPLQYSYLENPMDGGAWWATVHGVAKSRPDPSSKATLWVKAQHEGALPPPCIVRNDPRVPHPGRPGARTAQGRAGSPMATPWTVAHQAPPSMGFSRQEYWSGVPLPSP